MPGYMSKLIDKLNQSSPVSQPMGFGRAVALPPKPRMLLIASLVPSLADRLAESASGADAGAWHISAAAGIKALSEKSRAMPDIPWGCWLADTRREEIAPIVEADFDFIIFPPTTPLSILKEAKDSEVGYILQVDALLSEGLVRTINDLPVDAVLVAGEQGNSLTWHHLMLFQRFAQLTDKPLLATLPTSVTANDLRLLWEAGVDGTIIEVETTQTPVAELRQQVEKLSLPPSRKRGKVEALLPHIAPEPEIISEEEEE